MARLFGRGVVLALGVGAGLCPVFGPTPARAQTFERDVTVTGPRGRSVERQTEIRRGPDGISRDLTIRRPNATFERQTHIGRPPVYGGGGGWGGYRPPGRNVFVERDVFINRGGGGGLSGLADFGIGAAVGTGAGLLLGRAFAPPPPPPPVMIVPEPVYLAPPVYVPAPPPVVVYNPPVRYQPAPPPATVVVDPVAQAAARLASPSHNSRRDAAAVLGRLGDPRALPPLIDRLKFDNSKDVRVAAASALGEIGDPRAAIILERAIIYDKKQDVRNAASAALARMPRQTAAVPEGATTTTSPAPPPSVSLEPIEGPSVPAVDPIERVPPNPTPPDTRR